MIVRMKRKTKKYQKHTCQFCGSDRKLVETIIDDEFYWDETTKTYQPNGFTNNFEHTGYVQCAVCEQEWTGM
jgi:hypothetical protein